MTVSRQAAGTRGKNKADTSIRAAKDRIGRVFCCDPTQHSFRRLEERELAMTRDHEISDLFSLLTRCQITAIRLQIASRDSSLPIHVTRVTCFLSSFFFLSSSHRSLFSLVDIIFDETFSLSRRISSTFKV